MLTSLTTKTPPCPRCGRDGSMRAQFPAARNCTNCALLLWSQSEATYSANTYDGSLPAGTPRFIDGDRRIVLTAPNAVNYFRGEYQHKAARWTGSLVESLASASGFAALAAACRPLRVPYQDTPEPAFAARLGGLVAPQSAIVDIIGMRDRQVDVAIGLGPVPDARTKAVAARIERGFLTRGIRVGVNNPFPALAPVTVTSYAQLQLGLPALQVGLAAWLRDPDGSPAMAKLALDVLCDGLTELL